MILVIGGSLALSVYLTGRLSDRIGRKPLIFAGAGGAAMATIWMLSAENAGDVLRISSIIGFSIGALLSANWAMANDLGTSGREALHMGFVNLATIAGSALSKVAGPGIDLLNRLEPTVLFLGHNYTISGYSALLVGCGFLFLTGAFLLLPLKTDSQAEISSTSIH